MERIFSNSDLKKLIIPLVAEQALALTVGMADTLMVSSVGTAAISGVSLVDMINNVIFAVFSALATGGAVVTSQYIGARKEKEAIRSTNQLLYTVTIAGLLIMAFCIAFARPMLGLFFGTISDDVMYNCMVYLIISALSFPALAIYNGCAALFRAMGNSAVTFRVSIVMNLVNVVGNAICIYGFHMGAEGVAIPSLIGRLLAAVLLYRLLWNPDLQIHFCKEPIRFDGPMIRRILYIGIPSSAENGIFQLGRVVVVSIISLFGTEQIAANGVANSWDGMGCIVGCAMNLAMITVIGQCVGAGDQDQIRYYLKKLLVITYIPGIIINVLILLFLNPILGFYHLDPVTFSLSHLLITIHASTCMFLWPLSFTFPNMLRACNDVSYTMFISIFSMLVFRIAVSAVLGIYMGMGAVGVWIAMICDWIFRITMFVLRYLHGDWKRLMYR